MYANIYTNLHTSTKIDTGAVQKAHSSAWMGTHTHTRSAAAVKANVPHLTDGLPSQLTDKTSH